MKNLKPGQMWRADPYATQFHVLALYDQYVWYLPFYKGVSHKEQAGPRTCKIEEFPGAKLLYDPSS